MGSSRRWSYISPSIRLSSGTSSSEAGNGAGVNAVVIGRCRLLHAPGTMPGKPEIPDLPMRPSWGTLLEAQTWIHRRPAPLCLRDLLWHELGKYIRHPPGRASGASIVGLRTRGSFEPLLIISLLRSADSRRAKCTDSGATIPTSIVRVC